MEAPGAREGSVSFSEAYTYIHIMHRHIHVHVHTHMCICLSGIFFNHKAFHEAVNKLVPKIKFKAIKAITNISSLITYTTI